MLLPTHNRIGIFDRSFIEWCHSCGCIFFVLYASFLQLYKMRK